MGRVGSSGMMRNETRTAGMLVPRRAYIFGARWESPPEVAAEEH
jgi:hypothetical protein